MLTIFTYILSCNYKILCVWSGMQNALSLCSCVCGAFNFLWGAPTSETNMKKNERKKKDKRELHQNFAGSFQFSCFCHETRYSSLWSLTFSQHVNASQHQKQNENFSPTTEQILKNLKSNVVNKRYFHKRCMKMRNIASPLLCSSTTGLELNPQTDERCIFLSF